MGASCSVSPAETRVEAVHIQPEPERNPKRGTSPDQNGALREGEDTNNCNLSDGPLLGANSEQKAGLKSDSGFQDAPNSVPAIHLEDYNMSEEDNVILSDVGSDDVVDPSLNIGDTEKKMERSRRTSKMENEAITKQKLILRRMKSQETMGKDHEQPADVMTKTSPTAADEIIDPSLNINEVEERLTKTRRVSHSSYQQRLSLKKESLKKKTSLEVEAGTNQPANLAS